MLYLKLAYSNVRKSLSDYLVYFLTISFAVSMFYIINALPDQDIFASILYEMHLSSNSSYDSFLRRQMIEAFKYTNNMVSMVISTILGLVILYANTYLVKKRKKELGTYLLLGMTKLKISLILLLETILVGLFAFIIGILAGFIFSQSISGLIAKYMNLSTYNFVFSFSSTSVARLGIYFGAIFLLSMLLNIIIISKQKLIDLIHAQKHNERIKIPSTRISVLLFIVSLIVIGCAYNLLLSDSQYDDNVPGQMTNLIESFGKSVIIGSLGTLLFFFSIAGFWLKFLSANQKYYLKNLNIFTTKQLSSKLNTHTVSLAAVCVMLLFSISILSVSLGMLLNKEIGSGADNIISHVKSENEDRSVLEFLKEKGINVDAVSNDYMEYRVFPTWFHVSQYIRLSKQQKNKRHAAKITYYMDAVSVSDYNKLNSNKAPTLNLNSNEYAIMGPKLGSTPSNTEITISQHRLKCKADILPLAGPFVHNTFILILPDNVLNKDTLKNDPNNFSELKSYLKINYKDDYSNDELKNFEKQVSNTKCFIQVIKRETELRESFHKITMLAAFTYIGLILLLSSVAILAIQQLSQAAENIERYRLLSKLGADDKMINRSILKQIATYFMLPLSLALIHIAVAIRYAYSMFNSLGAFDNISENSFLNCTIISIIVILCTYVCYFFATYYSNKKMIQVKSLDH